MQHLKAIQAYIKTLVKSEALHALVVQSSPGWGKSTTIDVALAGLGIQAVAGGAYATPLHIYNTMCRNPNSLIVLDDCAGLFGDAKSMAILKAATWQSSTGGTIRLPESSMPARRVSWGSTSEKVEQPSVDFRGKLILLTNVVPSGVETEAFLSRCLNYRIALEPSEIKAMLKQAALSKEHFPQTQLARQVAEFLLKESGGADLKRISLRTLRMGYDLALTHPEGWKALLGHLLPKSEGASEALQKRILRSGLPAKEQVARFVATTGKSRRTYYNLKKQMGLTREYRKHAE